MFSAERARTAKLGTLAVGLDSEEELPWEDDG